MQDVRDCTTCAYGVTWFRLSNDLLLGKCNWECPVPHPPRFRNSLFSEQSPPVKDCPAWKQEMDQCKLRERQQWKEDHVAYRKRINEERERRWKEYEQKYGKRRDE